MSKCKRNMKKLDLFGHPILFHLDFKGQNHKTLFGGFLTIIYCLFTIGYLLFCIFKMIYHI